MQHYIVLFEKNKKKKQVKRVNVLNKIYYYN